ncbi:MAG: hypothetical protein IPJ61_18290 [Tessaracoccus sp.]|uniref:phage tail assembly chaperone n=1 Tax=Tessaracoccus sp. TaxID=1971211 RepID=UPI001ECEE1F2|nr:phage tail assembly chaperone [Tessaracoccus sp.]MBK7822934.1 hypothetical protein [Tessaracoccus sp.]
MAKITLAVAPTFKLDVSIPVIGERNVTVGFTFKGRSKTQFNEYMQAMRGMADPDAMMETVCGWDQEHEFNRDNMVLFLESHPLAAEAVLSRYMKEYLGARLGN